MGLDGSCGPVDHGSSNLVGEAIRYGSDVALIC